MFVMHWCSVTAEMRFLAIDDHLADLNVVVEEAALFYEFSLKSMFRQVTF